MYNVFLVDDEPFIIEGMKSIIDWEDYGLNIIGEAYDGQQALNLLQDKECHILLTDIMMPGMNGLELIQTLKKAHSNIRYIVLSGYQEFEYVKKGISLGIENYLLKPIDEEELISTLRNTIEKLDKSKHEEEDGYVLRDNAIWRWLNQEMSNQELWQRLEMYDIDHFHGDMQLAILQVEFSDGHTVQCISYFRKWIESSFHCFCVVSPDHKFILIWLNKGVDQVKEYLEQLQNDLSEKENVVDYFIALGPPASSSKEIFDSFQRTKDIAEFRLFFPESSRVITDQLDKEFAESSKIIQTFNFRDLVKYVLDANKHEVEKWIHSAFYNFKENISTETSKLVRGFAIELMIKIKNSVGFSDDLTKSAEIVKMILEADTIVDLKKVVMDFVSGLIDQINNRNENMSPIVQSVLKYIHEHYHEELSLKTLSQRFHVNAVYLGQRFQKEVGSVFSDYINQLRIEKAKIMLKESHLKAGEIGKRVGYTDPTYFYKQFKKYVGLTPTEWRSL
jgi:two-component system, response regulator YesN